MMQHVVQEIGRKARPVIMKRAYTGLYHGKHIDFGNTVSFSKTKTRRSWKPNVFRNKKFFSEILQKDIRFTVTSTALRTIEKLGGIDNYLAKTKDELILNPLALDLKQEILQKRRLSQSDTTNNTTTPIANNNNTTPTQPQTDN